MSVPEPPLAEVEERRDTATALASTGAWILLLLFLVGALVGAAVAGVNVRTLLADPAAAAGMATTRPWIGALSIAGALVWCVSFTALAVAARAATPASSRAFFAHGAAVVGVLMVDDAFLLHDHLAPRVTGSDLAELAVIGLEAALVATFVIVHRSTLAHRAPLLLVVGACFALSLGVDVLVESETSRVAAVEDGAKLAGILTLARVSLAWVHEAVTAR